MKLLKASEAGQMLGLTNTYLYRLAKLGEIKIVKVGSRGIRFSEIELKKWLKEKNK